MKESEKESRMQEKKAFYRIMRDPEESWKPYRWEPMYNEYPEMGSYQSSYGISSPKAGDYLVMDQTGTSVQTASDRDFEDVQFSAMPSLDEMLSSGMVVRVPQHLIEQDLAWQNRLQSVKDQIESLEHHLCVVQLYIEDIHQNPALAQSDGIRNAFADVEKTQTDIAELEGQLLNLEEEYQRFSEEHFVKKDMEERRFLSEDAWGSRVYPQNVDELVAAFNRSMNDYIQAADLHPEIAEDEIQKKADQLWLHYCKTGEIDGVQAQWQAEPELSKPPVARIDFLSSSGRVGDSMEYTDLQDFERELTRETYYGVPMSVVLYKNADGSVPPHQFVFELDPPPKGFAVADNPYIAQQDGLCQNSIDIGQEIDAVDYEMEM